MLSENKKFHYIGELILNRSKVLEESCQPKDDTVNWLFLNIRGWNYSFVYKFENPSNTQYGKPFRAKFAFTAIDVVRSMIKLNHTYEVLRGQEFIGTINITKIIK